MNLVEWLEYCWVGQMANWMVGKKVNQLAELKVLKLADSKE